MDFKEFANQFTQDVQNVLADSSPGARVTRHEVEKLQGESYTALSVGPKEGAFVSINLEALYQRMEADYPYEDMVKGVVRDAERYLETGGLEVDSAQIVDYERAKEFLCVEVVGTERNKEMLEKIPHTDVENMSLVYRVQLGKDDSGLSTVLVTNQMLGNYGVSAEQLHADAMESSARIRPAAIMSMQKMMAEMMGMSVEDMPPEMALPLFVVTNEDKVMGAAAVFYPEVMEHAAKELNGSYFVLPSSVHEVLLFPDDGETEVGALQAMVREINANEVQPRDRLSDQVYHYDAGEKVFELGEKFEARKAEKDKMNEKSSVLEELRSKQKTAEVKPLTPKSARSQEAEL